MGCWSESCAVSGVEISCGSKMYAMTWEKVYDGYMISIPPVAGTYDDYGGIDLTEDLPEFGLKKGDNWRPVDDKRGKHMFIDAAVFDFLASIEPEFTYGDRPKTLGEVWSKHREKLIKLLELWITIRDSDSGETDKAISRLRSRDHEVFGYSDEFMKNAEAAFQDAIDAGGTIESLTPLIEAYGRSLIVFRAFSELRKKPTFGTATGPQHGGEQALIPFYAFVLNLARKRRDGNRDDGYSWEEMDKDYPMNDWLEAVSNGATLLGFRDWQIDQDQKTWEA